MIKIQLGRCEGSQWRPKAGRENRRQREEEDQDRGDRCRRGSARQVQGNGKVAGPSHYARKCSVNRSALQTDARKSSTGDASDVGVAFVVRLQTRSNSARLEGGSDVAPPIGKNHVWLVLLRPDKTITHTRRVRPCQIPSGMSNPRCIQSEQNRSQRTAKKETKQHPDRPKRKQDSMNDSKKYAKDENVGPNVL